MPLKPHIAALVDAYHQQEGPTQRGPRFEALALALEAEMPTEPVTVRMVLDCCGPPDYFAGHTMYVYLFDHEKPGRNKDEWFFLFANFQLVQSGFNRHGANDLSELTAGSQFTDPDQSVRGLNITLK